MRRLAQLLVLLSLALPGPVRPAGRAGEFDYYVLALSWNAAWCAAEGDARDAAQCEPQHEIGFTLHGLWPDGVGKDWPQYCQATPLLSREVIQQNICSTPSAQLLQHEWSKHGTCMSGYTPERYFAQSTGLYAKLRYPDMNALSRRPLTAGKLAQAVADANPGLAADMTRITANRRGWLDEIWLCLDKTFRYQRCPAHQGGLAPNASVKIWRGMR